MVRLRTLCLVAILAAALGGVVGFLVAGHHARAREEAVWRPRVLSPDMMFHADFRPGKAPGEMVADVRESVRTDAYWAIRGLEMKSTGRSDMDSARVDLVRTSPPTWPFEMSGRRSMVQNVSQWAVFRVRIPGAAPGPIDGQFRLRLALGPSPNLSRAPLTWRTPYRSFQAKVLPKGDVQLVPQ